MAFDGVPLRPPSARRIIHKHHTRGNQCRLRYRLRFPLVFALTAVFAVSQKQM